MTDAPVTDIHVEEFSRLVRAIEAEVGRVIVGQREVVRGVLICVLASRHALLEGVPGLGKTMLIRALADALDLKFARIQFTPDLMPADITGTDILEEDHTTGKRFFKFIRGPVFCNMLLADEINRTPPKTQAALLQAMQEHQVTASGTTYPLEPPFSCSPRRTPSSRRGPTRSPRRSSTGSCSAWGSSTRPSTRRSRSSGPRRPGGSARSRRC
jgi:MoxR-like ATPases